MNLLKLNQNEKDELNEYFKYNFFLPFKSVKHYKNPNKMLVIADMHLPFHHQKYFTQTINDNLDCLNLYIVGDAFDFYSMSRFRKIRTINLRDELPPAYDEFKNMCKHFETVYYMAANHDYRPAKYLYDNVPNELLYLVKTDIVMDLIKLIPNVKLVTQQTIGARQLNYIHQLNDVVFSHVEISSVVKNKPVQDIYRKLRTEWEYNYNIKNYKAIIQGHNHTCGWISVDGCRLYHIPSLINIDAQAFDYVYDGRLRGCSPSLGYMVITWDNNKIDLNKTYIYEWQK